MGGVWRTNGATSETDHPRQWLEGVSARCETTHRLVRVRSLSGAVCEPVAASLASVAHHLNHWNLALALAGCQGADDLAPLSASVAGPVAIAPLTQAAAFWDFAGQQHPVRLAAATSLPLTKA